jgi:hypothetical protein
MANSLGSTGNAEQDLYIRQKFFQSKGMDEQGATILALKMDNIFSKENQKLLDEAKVSASTQKEMMSNLINSQEKHAKIQEGLLRFQIKLTQLMVDFAMIGALYSVYALQKLRGGDVSGIEGAIKKFENNGSLSDRVAGLFNVQMGIIKGLGMSNLMSQETLNAAKEISTALFGGDNASSGKYAWQNLRNHHTGGYIEKYHDGGIIGSYKALVKDNEAMFLGNIGASVVPEKNINIMTNDKLASLIEGVKSNILSSAVGQAVASKQSNQTDVNINISGNVFALNDFKKIIRDTVLEVIGGR